MLNLVIQILHLVLADIDNTSPIAIEGLTGFGVDATVKKLHNVDLDRHINLQPLLLLQEKLHVPAVTGVLRVAASGKKKQ
jgi:hypothetical protein